MDARARIHGKFQREPPRRCLAYYEPTAKGRDVNTTGRRCIVATAIAMLLPGAAMAQITASWPASGGLHARFERMAERDLKLFYLRCSRDSSQRRLDFGEAAGCSAGSEVLKQRSFGGDFDALLAWWRIHRDDPIPPLDER